MLKLLPLIIFIFILWFLSYLDKKCWYGLFLNKKIKQYYKQLKYHLHNLSGSDFVDEIIKSAVKNLKSLYSLYKKPPINDLYNLSKDIFVNYNNYTVVNAWAVFYIYTYIKNSNNPMVNKQYLKKEFDEIIKYNFKEIPKTFIYHFGIKKEQA